MSETVGKDMELDIAEKRARIEQLLADVMLKELDSLKRAQDIRFGAVTVVATSVAATAALIGAVVAFLKFLG